MLTNLTNQAYDRFIVNRDSLKSHFHASPQQNHHPSTSLYNCLIKNQLFASQDNIYLSTFSSQESVASASDHSHNSSKLNQNVGSPVKVLDVPKYKDDFYVNNIDWSSNGPLGIALDNEVFLYTPQSLFEVKNQSFDSHVTGIKIFDQVMAVGLSNGETELYDLVKSTKVRTLSKHQDRVSALMFLDNLLVTGSKDKSILVNDIRQQHHVVKHFQKHRGQICTLKPKNNIQKVFASGSTDGSAIIWDIKFGFIEQFKGHKGAVKALDWCPWKNGILATGGGGGQEKTIKVWNTTNSALLHKQNVHSQITSILWNQEVKMMVTSHGYSDNELQFWSLDSKPQGCKLTSTKKFKAHSGRVLNLQQSSDQTQLCTVGSDQTLKFWLVSKDTSNPFDRMVQRGSGESRQEYRV